MSDQSLPDASTWLTRFAEALGVPALDEQAITEVLALASVAAHSSERKAAPVACWLAAVAGRPPAEALAVARELPGAQD